VAAGPLLRMQVRRDGATAVLRLTGEADVATAPRLEVRLRDVVGDLAVERVVVDAAELGFLDLAGLDVLLGAAAELRDRGGQLVLRSPTRRVRRLLRVLSAPLAVED
jgi:anti-sigma B factor antagonist